ncbi:TDP-N-acetylfucosamine:lipid II N-acetylfucosaminyltransferase [Vibrio metschnikovii]|uniref:TDP-N-acetylfucosamine:lipid II N-acetylfucosaminyltransferase n=1 Tax=Vibrio metschnikovii TaxID=28172 RepID=UPI0013022587|nr:TDP-N-acetylfucosamine:lipid II N-acetylfucosaminyltransferase [Vibrio metschnikovii]
MSNKFLHIGTNGTFINSFIEFIKEEFDFNEHYFLITSDNDNNPIYSNATYSPRTVFSRLKYYFEAIIRMHQAKKIVLHGIFDIKLNFILFLMPWLLKKCHWVIWGGDLYVYQLAEKNWKWNLREFLRRPVIKNMGHLITYVPGDVKLARQWYGAKGKYHECLMYLSNVVDPDIINAEQVRTEEHARLNILVGNSADPSNNHIELLEKLLPYKEDEIRIFVPLSYGDQEHAKKVIETGKTWFGDKFVPLTTFMEFDEYLKFLKNIDIAIFNHKRQQAMGNTITLLGMGKTVYMRAALSHYDFIIGLGLHVKDVAYLSLGKIDNEVSVTNSRFVSTYFSKENLKQQLSRIFEG